MKVILLLLCGLLISCATESSTAPTPPEPLIALTPEEADIYEAVFRHQFANYFRGPQQFAGTFFIGIRRTDPPNAFLLRFQGDTPPVKRRSDARWGAHAVPYDPETREESILFGVQEIRWIGKNSVEVGGGSHAGDLGSSSSTYRLIRQGNKWKVVNVTEPVLSDARGFSAVDRNV